MKDEVYDQYPKKINRRRLVSSWNNQRINLHVRSDKIANNCTTVIKHHAHSLNICKK